MKILAYDIETRPNLAYVWGLWDQNIALNQLKDRVAVFSFAARWVDEPKSKIMFHSDYHDGHDQMIERAWELLDEADALLSWNGKAFDTKHVQREFFLAGLGPTRPFKEIDLLTVARREFKFGSNKLENVASEILGEGKVKHSGFDLWVRCLANDPKAWAEMARYNKKDVHLLVDLYEHFLPWIRNHPNQNLYNGTEGACPNCGGFSRTKQGVRHTLTRSYQRYRCTDCLAWSTGTKMIDSVETKGLV